MIGKWIGWYEYDDVRAQLLTAAFKSGYIIIIESFDGHAFAGSVKDDPKTSPMHDEGKVEGRVDGSKIYFKKLMPKTHELDSRGNFKIANKPHPAIYYEGTIDKSQMTAKGNWFFKKTIGFMFGFIPIPFRPGKGTWEMKLENPN
jgi:hypothetical protein